MAVAALSPMDKGVLLEAGTNEVEILVFHVGRQRCGVNVAKVREVRAVEPVTHLPHYPEAVNGVIRIRESVVPLVDLRRSLWGDSANMESAGQESELLLEYNDRLIAFRVQGIERIFRVSWKDLMPLPECPGLLAPVTGVLLLEGSIVALLDFESIGAQLGINGDPNDISGVQAEAALSRADCPIIYVDDSQLIRRMLGDALAQVGYNNLHGFNDGQEAWEYLCQVASETPADQIARRVGAVVSDIEMPRLDGFSLTRRIREHSQLKDVPVVLFSSLVSKDNEKKGIQVGATAQISKPRWQELTSTLADVLDQILT
jgi:two-component system, chemotaxis family, chemotaxis protein CheV